MSDDPRLEELAALQALGLLDQAGQGELLNAIDRDPKVGRLLRGFTETAAEIAREVPPVVPPPELKRDILRQLPARSGAKIIPLVKWLPYAIAACLMSLGIYQAVLISNLKTKISSMKSEEADLRQQNDFMQLRLATLEAKDAAYLSARVTVAWDPRQNRGIISVQNLPAPPPGHDYQLWVLDPGSPAPVAAGLLTVGDGAHTFSVKPVTGVQPGFAISLEPSGGRPEPTGEILFAVAPPP